MSARPPGSAQAGVGLPSLAARLAGLYGATVLVGFVIFVALFEAGAVNGIQVLFFRGLVLAPLACIGTFVFAWAVLTRWRPAGLSARDAFSAAILSLSFNTCFLVVVPVTVDRSISIFVLGTMNAAPDRLYSADEMSRVFETVYVGDFHQIDRRLHEQALTGNVEAVGDRYRITPRGRFSIATAKLVVWLFGGDARLADPPRATGPDPVSEGR